MGFLHSQQFVFTKGRSTTNAGIKIISYILESWEKSQDAIGIFVTSQKRSIALTTTRWSVNYTTTKFVDELLNLLYPIYQAGNKK